MQPQLTVIIPVYNVKPFLERCLKSVCEQTYKALEIICVDDGSTDGSTTIIEDFAKKDSRIKVIRQENQGLSAARNAGLKITTSDWVTGVDSDDYLEPHIYEEAMKYVEEHDLICFDAVKVTESGTRLKRMSELAPYNQTITDRNMVYQFSMVAFWNKIWSMKHIRRAEISFPVGLWYEDAAFFYKYVATINRAILIPTVGYHYVQRKGSIMWNSARRIEKTFDYIEVSMDVFKSFQKQNLIESQKDALLWIWRRNYISAESNIPETHHRKLKNFTKAELQQLPSDAAFITNGMSDLLKEYPSWLRLFYSRTATRRTFRIFSVPLFTIKHTPENKLGHCPQDIKLILRFLGIDILKITKRKDTSCVRILGIPVIKKHHQKTD